GQQERQQCHRSHWYFLLWDESGQADWPPDLTRFGARDIPSLTPGLDVTLDERERCVGDLSPAAIDGKRVPAVGHLDDLGHALIVLLEMERRVRDSPRDRVVLLAGDDQQRPALRVLAVDLRFRPRVEVGGRSLE